MSSSAHETWLDHALRGLSRHERERSPAAIPGYEIGELLGEGASAAVFRAWDPKLKRAVAIKILKTWVAQNETARLRFEREAQAAARLAHLNVLTLFDVGEEKGHPYLVMELVEGRPLSEVLKEVPRDERRLVGLLERAARGVADAHAKGIVHRDLKPENILVTRTDEPKVGDFGLAHLVDSTTALTKTGTTLGTPQYMAPEQVEGRARDISPRTDVYALGVILYEILVGRPPHTGETVIEIYGKIGGEEPVPPRRMNPAVPPDLETLALKALEKDPDRRYSSAGELADDLRRWLDGEPIEARPVSRAVRGWRRMRKHRRILFPSAVAVTLGLVVALWAVGFSSAKTRKIEDLERKARLQDAALWEQEDLLKRRAAAPQGSPADESGEVVFTEDFENYNRNGWNEYGGTARAISIVAGRPGRGKCLQLTSRGGDDAKVYLYRLFPKGLDTCHARFYVKYSEKDADYVHQAVRLVGYNPPTGWPQVRPWSEPAAGNQRLELVLEPSSARGTYSAPGVWRLMTDRFDLPADRKGNYWMPSYLTHTQAEPDRWICVEVMLKCNSRPDLEDGEQALWIDGEEVARWSGLRWRTDAGLKVNGIQLLNHLSERVIPSPESLARPRRVWFDDVAISRSYIGPVKP